MPLIKIWNYDRSLKKMIQADDLNTLLKEGALKLGYEASSNLKVVTESDGTEVDSDEIFSALISENMFPSTILMLLPQDLSWCSNLVLSTNPQSTNLAPSLPPISLLPIAQYDPEPIAEDMTVSSPSFFTVPYNEFPRKFINDCEMNKMPEKHLIRKSVRIVAQALMKYNALPERALIRVIAEDIVNKYPVLVCPNTVGTQKGYETIFTKLENCVHNLRRPIKLMEKEYAKGTNSKRSRPKKDQYGCVNWQPILLEEESHESQEIAQKSLIDMHKMSSTDKNLISSTMSRTYATQRLLINSKATIAEVEKSWPFLFERSCFIEHANKLLGIDILCVWNKSLEKVPSLMSYFRTLRKKNTHVDKLLQNIEEAVVRQKTRQPELSALLLLLCTYFGEEESQILSFFDVATSLDVLKTKKKEDQLMHPSICLLGDSLWNNYKGYVLVENVVVGDLAEINDLLPILFICYYVFNLCYPSGAEATLEFLQREFFNINPPGHKRGGKKKRTTVHPKVSTLQFNLLHHNSQWGHVDGDSDTLDSD